MRFTVIVLLALLLLVPVAAQDDLVEIPLSGAYSITVPEDWEVTSYTGAGYYWESDNSTIRIRTYSPSDLVTFEFTDIIGAFEDLVVNTFGAREFDEDALEAVTIGDYEGFSYTIDELNEGRSYQRILIIVESDNGFSFMGNLLPLEGETVDVADAAAVSDALASIAYHDTFTMYEGTEFELPEGWELLADLNNHFAFATLKKGSVELNIELWPGYGAIAGFEEPAGFLAYAFSNRFEDFADLESFDRSRMEDTQVAGFDAVQYTYIAEELGPRENYMRAVIAFKLTNNGIITATARTASMDEPFDVIYEVLDTITPGTRLVCALFADPGIRVRSEPSANSELVRQTEDEVVIALAKTVDSAGYTWFDIGEGWIRSDVIFFEQNACARIPEV
jgi:hypothetical protein